MVCCTYRNACCWTLAFLRISSRSDSSTHKSECPAHKVNVSFAPGTSWEKTSIDRLDLRHPKGVCQDLKNWSTNLRSHCIECAHFVEQRRTVNDVLLLVASHHGTFFRFTLSGHLLSGQPRPEPKILAQSPLVLEQRRKKGNVTRSSTEPFLTCKAELRAAARVVHNRSSSKRPPSRHHEARGGATILNSGSMAA
jgi:hypothetical protein